MARPARRRHRASRSALRQPLGSVSRRRHRRRPHVPRSQRRRPPVTVCISPPASPEKPTASSPPSPTTPLPPPPAPSASEPRSAQSPSSHSGFLRDGRNQHCTHQQLQRHRQSRLHQPARCGYVQLLSGPGPSHSDHQLPQHRHDPDQVIGGELRCPGRFPAASARRCISWALLLPFGCIVVLPRRRHAQTYPTRPAFSGVCSLLIGTTGLFSGWWHIQPSQPMLPSTPTGNFANVIDHRNCGNTISCRPPRSPSRCNKFLRRSSSWKGRPRARAASFSLAPSKCLISR